MRHHEAGVGIGGGDRVEMELVVGCLEEPQIRWASRAEQLHDATVVFVGVGEVGFPPPVAIARNREHHLLTVERHPEGLGVLHRGVDLEDVHRAVLGGATLQHGDELQPPRVGRFLVRLRRRARARLLPTAKTSELRVERQHVGERGGARARQAVDVNRAAHRHLADLRMVGVPRLDFETVDEPPTEVTDHRAVGIGMQVTVALEAVEQHPEPFAKVARTEVGSAGLRRGLVEQLVGGRITAHRLSRPSRDRGTGARPCAGSRHASPPGTAR